MSLVIKTELKKLAEFANADPAKFWETIKAENKSKKWTLVPAKIEVRGADIIDNSAELAKIADEIEKKTKGWQNKASLEELETAKDNFRTLIDWLKGSRTQVTNPLTNISKKFTPIEKKLEGVRDEIVAEIKRLNQTIFLKREKLLRDYIVEKLNKIKQEQDVELKSSLFDDFIYKRRENEGTTNKAITSLSSKVKKEIDALIQQHIEPILKEREAQRLKEQDISKLTLDMQNIDVSEDPEGAIEALERLKANVEIAYPNAVDYALTQINANIQIAKNAIEAKKAKEEAEKTKAAEDTLIEELNKLGNSEELEELEADRKKLKDMWLAYKGQNTLQALIEQKGQEVSKKIANIKASLFAKDVAEPKEDTKAKPKTKKFAIDLFDLQVLSEMEFEASDEAEAKVKITEAFKDILEIAKLIEKE